MIDSVPYWNKSENLDFIMDIVGKDDAAAFARENIGFEMNEEIHDRAKCFTEHLVLDLFAKPRVRLSRPIHDIFVVIDPTAGTNTDNPDAAKSDFVILSIGVPGNIILGVDALHVNRTEDYQPALHRHLTKIRQMEYCRESRFIIDVESGTGTTAGDIPTWIRRQHFGPMLEVQDMKFKPGTVTSSPAKAEMAEMTQRALLEGNYYFCQDLVTSHPRPNEMLAKFRDQLCAYERYVSPNGNQLLYSGKGVSKTEKDDLALTFQRAIRLQRRMLNNAKAMLTGIMYKE
jgi:hypothetical protein